MVNANKQSASNSSEYEFDPIQHELSKYDIDLRSPTGIYGKKKSNLVLIVSTDAKGNYYITKATSQHLADKILLTTNGNEGVDSIVDLEAKLAGYHKWSHRTVQKISFTARKARRG